MTGGTSPLASVANLIDRLNDQLGRGLSWLVLALILVQLAIVVLRYVFQIGSVWVQESLLYGNALLFLGAAGYTLLKDAHVRVDLFYREASAKTKAWVNLLGVLLFLWPLCGLIGVAGIPYVAKSWAVFEGSVETTGLQAVYLLKSLILLFGLSLALQGLSLAIRSWLVIGGDQ